ncbi:MAG: nucleic acid-binding protein [Treponemataceae bacterium]|nr:nucleic acid-binding protein [Treponemataceae bacterium]
MVEVFDKLRNLQEVLSEKYELQAQIDEAPKLLTSQDELLARLKKEFIEKNGEYDDSKAKVSDLKVKLAQAEAQREKAEKDMDNVATHREYETLEKEINDSKELGHTVRKELEKEEKRLAELNDTLNKCQEMIQSQESELEQSKASLDNEVTQYQAKLTSLEKQEAELSEGIDSEIIFKFKRIVKSKHNKGIVAVKGNVCDGCHMILPAQFANDVHSGEKIVFCPYCSRILYYQEVEGDEEQYYQMDDTGSLADLDDDEFADEEDFDEDEDSEEKRSDENLDF